MREFNVSLGGQTVANGSVSLIGLRPAAAPSVNIEILRWWVGQAANATSAQQRITLQIKASAFPTFVAQTPVKLKAADPNASVLVGSTTGAAGTVGVNASGENGGAYTQQSDDAFNVLNGWLMVPTPPETFILPASQASVFVMQFPAAPATLSTWSWGCQYREV